MRVLLSWLRDYVDVADPPDVLGDQLPMLGLGVDGVEHLPDGDVVLDLEIASNRPDLLSLIGIAREFAAWRHREVRLPGDGITEVNPSTSTVTAVEIADAARCPRYVAHVITGVTVRPSPPWLASRLDASGIRPINAVVDATNYVMLEWGQPLHAFDLDTLEGRRIVVRPAAAGEQMVTLDGVARDLDPEVLVIADARRPVALAGIMGGADTEIAATTRSILLEAAAFGAASVRRTSRRMGLRTEASTRFERGIDPEGTMRAARRAAHLIAELGGGSVLRAPVDAYPGAGQAGRPAITLRPARIDRLLGTHVPADEAMGILSRLGVEVRGDRDVIRATPPVGRRDLEREEDLIEEVARHFGYDRIPGTMPIEAVHQGRRAARLEVEAAARDALIRAGLTEALTVSLVNQALLDRLDADAGDRDGDAIWLKNPLTTDHTRLRPILLPSLLEAVRVNVSRRREAVHLFEMGRVFARRPAGRPDGEMTERRHLAIVMRGRWLQGVWDQQDDAQDVTFFHLKGVLQTLLDELRLGPLSVAAPRERERWLHPGRAGQILIGETEVGYLGELTPIVAERFELPGRTYVAELDLEVVLDRAVLQPRFAGLPRYPAVRRDVAVVAPLTLAHALIEGAIRDAVGELLEAVELFDVYSGPPLDAGMRNLAYALTLRAPDRTLTGDEVEAIIHRVHTMLPGRLPVTIRV
jgi:phenylalanyl-tRNA synthetase beta chain